LLTDVRCRSAKKAEKPYKLADSGGLYLMVTTTGFRSWRMKYRFAKKEKLLTFGAYPDVSLVEARGLRDAARKLLRSEIDPTIERLQREAEVALAADTTFKSVTLAWHKSRASGWKPRYAEQILQRFKNDVFPAIGSVPIDQVTPALVLRAIRAIEAREANVMAHRVRQHISDVFVYAIASGWTEDDPSHVIRKALVVGKKRLRPAVTKLADAQYVLTLTEAEPAYAVTKLAARLLALTAARPGVVRLAEAAEFERLDSSAPIWRIPAVKMKLTKEERIDATFEFVIPLSRQAVEVVKLAMEIAGPKAKYLFHSVRSVHSPMSDSTLSKLYRDAGLRGKHVPHGWRATFSTLMNERAADRDRPEERAIIDLMLAHVQDGVEAAYNRAAYMPRRREIAQAWADQLTELLPAPASLVETQRGTSARTARRHSRDRRLSSSRDAGTHQGINSETDRAGARHRPSGPAQQL